jgi:hypothetical protein
LQFANVVWGTLLESWPRLILALFKCGFCGSKQLLATGPTALLRWVAAREQHGSGTVCQYMTLLKDTFLVNTNQQFACSKCFVFISIVAKKKPIAGRYCGSLTTPPVCQNTQRRWKDNCDDSSHDLIWDTVPPLRAGMSKATKIVRILWVPVEIRTLSSRMKV